MAKTNAVRSQLDVGRLQISVDDSGVVRGFKRLGNLAGNGDGFVNRDGSTGDAVSEGVTRHQLHDERPRGGMIRRRGFFDPEDVGIQLASTGDGSRPELQRARAYVTRP